MHASVLETSGQPCRFHRSPLCTRIVRTNSQQARPPSGTVASRMRSPRTTARWNGFPPTDSPSSEALRCSRAVSRISCSGTHPAPTLTSCRAERLGAGARRTGRRARCRISPRRCRAPATEQRTRTGRRRSASPSAAANVVLQAAVAGEWGRHAARAGDAVTAVALLEKSAELGRRAGDDAIVAKALVNLARVELDAGRGGHAMRNIGEALARDQRGELRAATAGLLIDVAAGAFHSGDTAHAELCLEQALSLERQTTGRSASEPSPRSAVSPARATISPPQRDTARSSSTARVAAATSPSPPRRSTTSARIALLAGRARRGGAPSHRKRRDRAQPRARLARRVRVARARRGRRSSAARCCAPWATPSRRSSSRWGRTTSKRAPQRCCW